MTFEQGKILRSCYKKKLGVVQITTEAVLKAESTEEIGKVLWVIAKPFLEGYEAAEREVGFTASVCFNAVYTTEMGALRNLKETVDTSSKIENESVTPYTIPMAKISVIDTTIKSVSSTEIIATAIIEVSAEAYLLEELSTFSGDVDVITKKDNFNCFDVIASGVSDVKINTEFDVKEAISNIVNSTSQVNVQKTEAGTDYFTVEGVVLVNIVYENQTDNEFKNLLKKIPFKEEVEVSGISSNSEIDLLAQINNCKIETTFKNSNDESEIFVNIPITINYVAYEQVEGEIITDAYSTETNCNLKVESVNKINKHFHFQSEQKIDTTISVGEHDADLIKVVGVGAENIITTKCFAENNEVVVEGIAYVNAICEQDDEQKTLTSLQAEIPFSFVIKNDFVDAGDNVCAHIFIDDIDAKVKRGKDIEIEMDLDVCVKVFTVSNDAVLTGFDCTEPLILSDNTLQIIFAKAGDSLWHISKNAHVNPELILTQNPEIEFPLMKNEKIILYKQK